MAQHSRTQKFDIATPILGLTLSATPKAAPGLEALRACSDPTVPNPRAGNRHPTGRTFLMTEHPQAGRAAIRGGAGSGFAVAAAALLLACGFAVPAQAAAGWQKPSTLDIPQGTKSFSAKYACPASDPVVVSGAFAANSVGQEVAVHLNFNGPRLDKSPPNFGEWAWHFTFVGAGAPAGVTITFDVFCQP
jgi:hypothetical protein